MSSGAAPHHGEGAGPGRHLGTIWLEPVTDEQWNSPPDPGFGGSRRSADQRRAFPGASRLVSSAMASGEGLKYRRRFSGFLCLDFAISISRLAPALPR